MNKLTLPLTGFGLKTIRRETGSSVDGLAEALGFTGNNRKRSVRRLEALGHQPIPAELAIRALAYRNAMAARAARVAGDTLRPVDAPAMPRRSNRA